MKNIFLLGAVSLLVTANSGAAVVWADDFTGTRATPPNSYDYAGGAAGDDYIVQANGNTLTAGSGVFNINDTVSSTSGDTLLAVTTSQWAARPANNGDIVQFSYSIRVNGLVAGGGASVPRFSIFQNASSTGNALGGGGSLLTIGFGYGAFADGDASNSDLGFYLATDPANVGAPIGLSGAAWAPGFDFGNYNAAAFADNDTNDQFYRVVIRMTEGSTVVTGTITNESNPAFTTAFSGNASSALNLKNTDLFDGFRIATGQGGTSNTDFSNLTVEVIPEPSAALLVGSCGLISLLRRRRA